MTELIAIYGIPGTGKTTYLKNKITELVNDGYGLDDIAYWTFRRNMANDFLNRLSEDGVKGDNTFISTIHSICWRMLSLEYGYNRKENVALPWKDYVQFCHEIGIPIKIQEIAKLSGDDEEAILTPDEVETLGSQIYTIYTNCINSLIPFEEWQTLPAYMLPTIDQRQIPPKYGSIHECVVDVIDKWLRWMEKNDKIDFAQMLVKALELKLTPDVAICMSDESHDMTPIQIKLAKLWSKEADAFYVAFDRSQCIYSFWGVDTSFCDEVWRKADERVTLTPSWRISQEVYDFARKILKRSGQSAPSVECIGGTKIIKITPMQFDKLINTIDFIAILARTRYHLLHIASVLSEIGIIFTGIGGWGSKMFAVYKTVWCVKNGLSVPKSDYVKFLKVYERKYFLNDKAKLERIAPDPVPAEFILDTVSATLKKLILEGNPFAKELFVNSAFSKEAIEKMKMAWRNNAKPIVKAHLVTIHGSKGLEWDNVLVIDGITKKINKSVSNYKSEFENEHRVWYVAFTRAKKLLFYMNSSFFPRGLNMPFVG